MKVVRIGGKWEEMGIAMAQAIRIEMNELFGMNKHPTNPIPLIHTNTTLFIPLVSKQTPHCRKTVFMKFTWKSFRIVSFINRFGFFSVFP